MTDKNLDLFAKILEQNAADSAAVHNHLIEDGYLAALRWAEKFHKLFTEIEKVNDSIKVGRILDYHYAPGVEDRIDHYRRMSDRTSE